MLEEEKGVSKLLFQHQEKVIIDKTVSQEPKLSFSSSNRVCKKKEIINIQTEGKRIYTRNLIFYVKETNLEIPRLVLTVSKKVNKRAVVRNLVKRRLREIYRNKKHNIQDNIDLMIIAKKTASIVSFSDLKNDYDKALERYEKVS